MLTLQQQVALRERVKLIKAFPCFAALSQQEIIDFATSWHEAAYSPQQKIVTEDELVDSIYIIVNGEAEVTHAVKRRAQLLEVPVAALRAEEGIGLNDTGFYSATGKRTATVTALSNMLLLRLDIKDLYAFLKKNSLELSMYAASNQMLRMRFIKQSLPFAKLSHERLQWLANHVEDLAISAGTILFKQGDAGNKCYLIRNGQIEILTTDEDGSERRIALLKPPVLFGEATLITHAPRNATARALMDCDVLTLRHEYLSELIESEVDVAHMFMTLTVDRSRPLRNLNVSLHKNITADGQEITVLKNPERGSYFKLSEEGCFIWLYLDGKHTLQDITLELAEKFNVFAPDVVAALILKLTKSGFITNIEFSDESRVARPFWVIGMMKIRKILEVRYAFGDADAWLSRLYAKYLHYFFNRSAQLLLGLISVLGLAAFIFYTPNILLIFSLKHASLLLLLGLIPLSLVEALLHELGHAFAVKAFGREVHYIGAGWYWFAPIAFTDTSDMWLSRRKPRMLVNLAGVYVDIIVSGIVSLIILLLFNHPYIQCMLWLFAFYTYVGAIRMLSPLQEMDGYYVLMDWVEKPRLKESAVIWLVKKFPACLRYPHLFKENWQKNRAEIYYWSACILFLVVVSLLTLIVQKFVLIIFGYQNTNPYLSLLLPFLVIIFSSLSIIADIRNQAEE